MEKMSLYELYRILENVRSSDYKFETIEYLEKIILEKERVLEDTSATGGPAGSAGAASVGYGGGGVSMGNATTAGMVLLGHLVVEQKDLVIYLYLIILVVQIECFKNYQLWERIINHKPVKNLDKNL
jgi:hypothetical protein